jgi:hypothetical protein
MPVTKIRIRNRRTGVSMTEYALAGALVITISLASLIMLGKSLNTSIGHFRDSLAAQPGNSAPSTLTQADTQRPNGGGKTASYIDTSFLRTVAITLSSGKQITLDGYPDDLPKSIVALGANGTTAKLLATLERLTQELQAQGEITEEQAATLRNLANRGHDMAEREKWIENYLANSSNDRPQLGVPVVYKGETYGDFGKFGQSIDIFTNGSKSDTQAAFDAAYQQALNSSALQDPAVRAVVESLVQDIVNVADTFAEGTYKFVNNPDRFPTYNSLLDFTASRQTHENSAAICHTDHRADTGVQCL